MKRSREQAWGLPTPHAEKRTSVNKAVISILEEHAGIPGKKKHRWLHHDLDALAGSWTKREGSAFERALARQRAIDAEEWK